MDCMEEVNWSAVARRSFEEKIKQIKLLNDITSRSKLTEKDALEIGKKINKAVSKKFMEMK